jgi:hypothetical protein
MHFNCLAVDSLQQHIRTQFINTKSCKPRERGTKVDKPASNLSETVHTRSCTSNQGYAECTN